MDPRVALLFLAWGFIEATAAWSSRTSGSGFSPLATPAALGLPLASAIAGGVIGALALVVLRQRPDVVDRILAFQPGLGRPGWLTLACRSASAAVPRSAKSVPGLPLKAYRGGLSPRSSGSTGFVEIADLAFLNRLTRVVPTVAAFALLGYLARRSIFPPVRSLSSRSRMDPLLCGILVDPPAGGRPYEHL